MTDIFAFLDRLGVPYERHDHAAVFTVEEALEHVPVLPGGKLKNLFLCDRKGKRDFLVVVGFEKRVNLKALAAALEVPGLRFASPERLQERLGLEPGAVSILGVVNDRDGKVEVVIDRAVWQCDPLQCHPLVNTSTVVIPREGVERFFEATGHTPRIMDVPGQG